MSPGYSGTPLAKKLGIKPGATVALLGAPGGFASELEPLPDGVTIRRQARGPLDVALLFVTSRRELTARFRSVGAALAPNGGLWVAWPKRASGVPTDLTEGVIQEYGLSTGMVDNKVCAVTDVWSGLRFVIRLTDR